MLQIIVHGDDPYSIAMEDPNVLNLVEEVSLKVINFCLLTVTLNLYVAVECSF